MFQMMILVFCALPVTKKHKAEDLLISALAGLLAQSDRQILVIYFTVIYVLYNSTGVFN